LKDGASTAIYGTRGANGVILITTKKGGSGKTHVNFNSYVSLNSPSFIANIMNTDEFKQKRFETLIADQENSLYNAAGIAYNATTGAVTWDQSKYPDPAAVFGTVTLDAVMQSKGVTDPNKLLTSAPTALQLLADGVSLNYLDMIFKNSISQNYEFGINGGDDKTAVNFSLGFMDDRGLLRGDEMLR
jgi:TonB-dependent SusC/RagA subfamily outer membrane receptor